jgi:hypothetical protein
MTRRVLADYGEVISDPMPAETILELADLAGMQADEFRDRYWKFRPPYDLGQSDRAYWSAVLGHELQAEPQLKILSSGVSEGYGWQRGRIETITQTALPLVTHAPPAASRGGCTADWGRFRCLRGAFSVDSPETAPQRPGCRRGDGADNDSAVTEPITSAIEGR